MTQLDGLAHYLVNREFNTRELQRQYDVASIHQIVQRWIDKGGLAEAISRHYRRHDPQCELRSNNYRWCDCWRRQPAKEIGDA